MFKLFQHTLNRIRSSAADRVVLENESGEKRAFSDLAGDNALIVKAEIESLVNEIEILGTGFEDNQDVYLNQIHFAKGEDNQQDLSRILARYKKYYEWFAGENVRVRESLSKAVDQYNELHKEIINEVAKASGTQQEKISSVMGEYGNGTLKSGSGKKVMDRDQAIAIAMSEAGLNKMEGYSEEEDTEVDKVEKAQEYTKAQADYKEKSTGNKCKGCTHFGMKAPDFETGGCDLVKGNISPEGTCKYYKADKVEKSHHSSDLIKVPGDAELNANEPEVKDYTKHSVAVIVNNPKEYSEILLLKRSLSDDLAPGTWCLPGGGIEEGETPQMAAVRELKEETNLEAEPDGISACRTITTESGKKIYYFYGRCKDDNQLIALLDGENMQYQFMSMEDWEETPLILDLKAHLREIYLRADEELEKEEKISKAFDTLDELVKGKPAAVGEHRMYSGVEHVKTARGWIPVPKGKGDSKSSPAAKGSKGAIDSPTPAAKKEKPLDDHAKETPDHHLKRHAKESDDPKMKKAAKKELDTRGKDEDKNNKEKEIRDKVEGVPFEKRVGEKSKNWNKKQGEFYKDKGHEAHSKARSAMANTLRKKSKSLVVDIKQGVSDWKVAGGGLAKIFKGQKAEVTPSENKAIKQLATYVALTARTIIETAGISGAVSQGAALGKPLIMHYLERAGILGSADNNIYASIVVDLEKAEMQEGETLTPHYAIAKLLENIINHIESGAISEDDWMNISEGADSDFKTFDNDDD